MSDDLVANTSLKSPDLGLIGDHRGLSKLRQLGRGGKKEQALATERRWQELLADISIHLMEGYHQQERS